ncbi:hypothetical protein AO262_29315 [Pseudomonas fluorescens ABAC62]|nr:hypothetical protein AO262_29315 [Pseudomonas fluorescens ABAC62]
MTTNSVNLAVVDGKTITQTTEIKDAIAGQPVRVKAVANGKYILAEGDKGVAPDNITVKRVGKDLHIALEGTDPDQPQLIIEGFYEAQGQLVGVAEDGSYYEYIASDAQQEHSAAFLVEGVPSPQVLSAEPITGFGNGLTPATGIAVGWFWPALLGLAAVGALGAAYAINEHIQNKDDDKHDSGNDGSGSGNRPETPSVNGAMDNVGDKTGPILPGESTDDTTPSLSGSGTPGNTIIILDGETVLGEVTVGEDGQWEFTPEQPLGGGSHEITVVEEDAQGNQSEPSEGIEIIVDVTAPSQSAITGVQDDFGGEQGLIANNGSTDDNTPSLQGTAEPDSTVEVFANGVLIGKAPVNAEGIWSFTPTEPLVDGSYTFTTVTVDAAGNRGLESDLRRGWRH